MCTITLTPEQEAWLAAHVARGEFPSVEAAARRLIDDRIAEEAAAGAAEDFAWAKPLVDEAIAQIDRGQCHSPEEHDAAIDAHISSLRIR